MTNFFNRMGWVLAALVSLVALAAIAGLAVAGPLDPPGPPTSGTDKTVIAALPYSITSAGSYIVKSDLTCGGCAGSPGIYITTNNVTLDLNGFTLTQGSQVGHGISIFGIRSNVTIGNGALAGWEAGVVGGGSNLRVHDISVAGSKTGIEVFGSGVVENCSVTGAEIYGINANGMVVDGCSSSENIGATAIVIANGELTNCVVHINDSGVVTFGSIVTGCTIWGNEVTGITVAAGGNLIADNSISNVTGDGIQVVGTDSTIRDNLVSGVTTGPPASGPIGMLVTGVRNRIEGNSVSGFDYNYNVTGSDNVVVRNTSANGLSGNFYAGGNDVGPVESAATGGSPWANIEN